MQLLEEHINENIVKVGQKEMVASSFLIKQLYRSANAIIAKLLASLRGPYFLRCCALIVMEIWRPKSWVNLAPRVIHKM